MTVLRRRCYRDGQTRIQTQTTHMDPLTVLPSEIVLRILEFASIGIIANLTRTARSWHTFIDDIHQDAIYAAHLPRGSRSTTPNEYMGALKAFRPDSLSHGVRSWKEACRRRCLLQDAWDSPNPRPIATVIQIGSHPVWRFKPDFDRRLIVSTSQAGGVNVVDMDTGDLLWSLGRHEVRPFAHLEYQDGTAVWVCYQASFYIPFCWPTKVFPFPGVQNHEWEPPTRTAAARLAFQVAFWMAC